MNHSHVVAPYYHLAEGYKEISCSTFREFDCNVAGAYEKNLRLSDDTPAFFSRTHLVSPKLSRYSRRTLSLPPC